MGKLKMSGFKLTDDDNAKLNALVEDAKEREKNGMFPLRINRTSLLQQLIALAFARLQEDQSRLLASVDRAKKRAAKKKAQTSQRELMSA